MPGSHRSLTGCVSAPRSLALATRHRVDRSWVPRICVCDIPPVRPMRLVEVGVVSGFVLFVHGDWSKLCGYAAVTPPNVGASELSSVAYGRRFSRGRDSANA